MVGITERPVEVLGEHIDDIEDTARLVLKDDQDTLRKLLLSENEGKLEAVAHRLCCPFMDPAGAGEALDPQKEFVSKCHPLVRVRGWKRLNLDRFSSAKRLYTKHHSERQIVDARDPVKAANRMLSPEGCHAKFGLPLCGISAKESRINEYEWTDGNKRLRHCIRFFVATHDLCLVVQVGGTLDEPALVIITTLPVQRMLSWNKPEKEGGRKKKGSGLISHCAASTLNLAANPNRLNQMNGKAVGNKWKKGGCQKMSAKDEAERKMAKCSPRKIKALKDKKKEAKKAKQGVHKRQKHKKEERKWKL